jgi:hypothetical protein
MIFQILVQNHKKKLAVVVADVEVEDEYQFERRWYGSNPEQFMGTFLKSSEGDVIIKFQQRKLWQRKLWQRKLCIGNYGRENYGMT